MNHRQTPSIPWTAAGLVLLGLVLRLYGSDRTLGGGDEAEALLGFIYQPISFIVVKYFAASNHILHSIAAHLMAEWFGEDNAIALRAPSLILGIADLWLIYKTASLIFPITSVPLLALGIAALSPVHIYYAQTVRGYAMIMFFSTTTIFALLKVLTTSRKLLWSFLLGLCAFLSIYTIPTNSYFLFGLVGWLFLIFIIPEWGSPFFSNNHQRNYCLKLFIVVFTCILTASIFAYSPLIDQMKAVAQERILFFKGQSDNNNNFLLAVDLAGNILKFTFKNHLTWFIPILFLGILCGRTKYKAYRMLPVCVFLLPLLPIMTMGIGGYPRNYLFNFPLLVIFLSGGIPETRRLVTSFRPKLGEAIYYGLITLFILISAKILIFDYYPSVQNDDGSQYRKNVQAHTKSKDLILFANPKNYLYARTVFSNNLRSIFHDNQLQGVSIVAKDTSAVQMFQVEKSGIAFAIFKDQFKNLAPNPVSKNLNLFSLTSNPGQALLSEDFEIKTPWKLIQGEGNVEAFDQQKLSGDAALQLKTDTGFVIEAQVAKNLNLNSYHLAVLIWSGKNLDQNNDNFIVPPIILEPADGSPRWVLKTGSVNPGNRVDLNQWSLVSFIGMIPPGKYHLHLQLAAGPNQNILFDGLRLFLVKTF